MTINDLKRESAYGLVKAFPADALRWLGGRSSLRDLLAKLRINCVLDVGANCGQFGVGLRRLGFKGWILSFEPIQAHCDVLESVAERNGPWRVFRYALGSANDKLQINVSEQGVFSSFLNPKEESRERFPASRVVRTEEVQVKRLDDVLETCVAGIESPQIYLKMDTQGFDLAVAKGAQSVLQIVQGLQTEVSFQNIYVGMPGFMESIQEFQTRGFRIVDFVPVSKDRNELSVIEMDCLMARVCPASET